MDEEWYIKEIAKLICIIEQSKDSNMMVGRSYVKEKLERIINGIGIGIHPSLEKRVEEYIADRNRRFLI